MVRLPTIHCGYSGKVYTPIRQMLRDFRKAITAAIKIYNEGGKGHILQAFFLAKYTTFSRFSSCWKP